MRASPGPSRHASTPNASCETPSRGPKPSRPVPPPSWLRPARHRSAAPPSRPGIFIGAYERPGSPPWHYLAKAARVNGRREIASVPPLRLPLSPRSPTRHARAHSIALFPQEYASVCLVLCALPVFLQCSDILLALPALRCPALPRFPRTQRPLSDALQEAQQRLVEATRAADGARRAYVELQNSLKPGASRGSYRPGLASPPRTRLNTGAASGGREEEGTVRWCRSRILYSAIMSRLHSPWIARMALRAALRRVCWRPTPTRRFQGPPRLCAADPLLLPDRTPRTPPLVCGQVVDCLFSLAAPFLTALLTHRFARHNATPRCTPHSATARPPSSVPRLFVTAVAGDATHDCCRPDPTYPLTDNPCALFASHLSALLLLPTVHLPRSSCVPCAAGRPRLCARAPPPSSRGVPQATLSFPSAPLRSPSLHSLCR